MRCPWWVMVIAAPLLSGVSGGMGQKDILRDIARALKEPRPAAVFLARTPIFVVTNDERLFNLFRSLLPPRSEVTFVPLRELPERSKELAVMGRSLVALIDRSRGRFPIDYRYLVPYDLTLIRRQDVVIAADYTRREGLYRYRVFVSAPSFHSLRGAINDLCRRPIREGRDLRFVRVTPVPISVVITNAGREAILLFAEHTPLDFIWATPETLETVEDLMATETEIYLLTPPVPKGLQGRLPFDLTLLAPNQSVVIRKSKGGDRWSVLLYGAFPDALHYLIPRYADPKGVPEEPLIFSHPVIGKVQRLLIVPFGIPVIYRPRIGDLSGQVLQGIRSEKFAPKTIMPKKPPEPFLDWTPYQEGFVEAKHIAALAKAHGADLVLAGRVVGFETRSTRWQELTSQPSPAADRRFWFVTTLREQRVTALLEFRLYEGRTGELLFQDRVEGRATKRERLSRRWMEAPDPPTLQPKQVSVFVYDDSLYRSAIAKAVAELRDALRGKIRWLTRPLVAPLKPLPSPLIVEGIVGQVEEDILYLDVGSNQGVKIGDTFVLYREVLIKTERKVVRIEEEVGEAKVIAIYPEACKAQVVGRLKGKLRVGLRARLKR